MTTPLNVADLRRSYTRAALDITDVKSDPIDQFSDWFREAVQAQVLEPNAMCVATTTPDGQPSARMVLLKGFDSRGFVFFTDYRSRKSGELAAVPKAALCFHWGELERQVRIVGPVVQTTTDESADYFHSRPALSKVGAWASHQSSILPDRAALEAQVEEIQRQLSGAPSIPLPEHWGGWRVQPLEIEFWQGRESRLHDRIRFRRASLDAWTWQIDRLSP